MDKEEWKRRYAARIMEKAGWPERAAIAAAQAGADWYEECEHQECERNGGTEFSWKSPELEADEEMSSWTDDSA